MERVDTYTLLQHIELRLARIEQQQLAARRRAWLAITLAVLLLVAAGLWLVPPALQMKADYDAAVGLVEQLQDAVGPVDLAQLGDSLRSLQGLDSQLLSHLDPEMLGQLAERLQALDTEALTDALAAMDEIDAQALGEGLRQLQTLLQGLNGLDTASINTAVQNLNRALEPLLRLFDRSA